MNKVHFPCENTYVQYRCIYNMRKIKKVYFIFTGKIDFCAGIHAFTSSKLSKSIPLKTGFRKKLTNWTTL